MRWVIVGGIYMKPVDTAVRMDGKVHYGTYTVDDTIVRVAYRGKSKATQVGGSLPETIAGMLLRELIWDSRHRV
jgi:hypothetical protein